MKPLYTKNEFKEAKSRDSLPLQCQRCKNTFLIEKHFIQKAIAPDDHHKCEYCSTQCLNASLNSPTYVSCTRCGQEFKKQLKEIAKSKSGNHFCSKSCAAIWNNTHKKHGTRRSKLEKWLEEELIILYPDLEFHFNRKDAIESELDIFIPSLMLAFELNGIYHYEPIHGQKKLDAVRSNDKRKFAACHEARISLCSIDTSHQKYFKEQRAMKFLKIIQNIIDARLSDSYPAFRLFPVGTTWRLSDFSDLDSRGN